MVRLEEYAQDLQVVITDLAENEVGEAIKQAGVPRNELFITSKV